MRRAARRVRRAALAGSPEVWKVTRAIRSAYETEPDLDRDSALSLVSDNTELWCAC